tara:strand:- start:15 stop:482 length:468 start_codon:yes stop_codon:yes gene_type:complete
MKNLFKRNEEGFIIDLRANEVIHTESDRQFDFEYHGTINGEDFTYDGSDDQLQEAFIEAYHDELEEELWEAGRVYALGGILSDIEYPEGMTEEDIEEFCNTYEVVDCTPSIEDGTCEVEIEGDNGLRVTALGTVDDDDDISWEIHTMYMGADCII